MSMLAFGGVIQNLNKQSASSTSEPRKKTLLLSVILVWLIGILSMVYHYPYITG